jgi:glycosyltransferase involved in cell wall biosynthesis
MNPHLGASARPLQDWLLLGKEAGFSTSVLVRKDGALKRWLEHSKIPNRLNPMFWPDRWNAALSLFHAWKIKNWIKEQGVQIIHCYEHDLYPFAVLLRRMTALPLICHIHYSVDSGFAKWAFGGSRKQPDAVLWTSHQQQQDCMEAMNGLVPWESQNVIPLGLNVNRFGYHSETRADYRRQLGISPDEIVVGTACWLRPRKQIDDFMALIQLLQSRHCKVVGLLAGGKAPGDEDYAGQVIPRIQAFEANRRFLWLGHVEPIEPFMHATDIYVSTSQYESFGMSVLEAMACGKPVVAYRGGSVYEIVGNAGLIAKTGDFASLAALVESLVIDGNLRRSLGLAAKQRVVEDFNPQASFRLIRNVYESLL